MKRLVTLCVAALALAAGSPTLASAKVKTITPDMLRLADPANPPAFQDAYELRAGASGSEMYARIKVPVGAKLLKLEIDGIVRGAPLAGQVTLMKWAPGQRCDTSACDLFTYELAGFDPGVFDWQTKTAVMTTVNPKRVAKGELVQLDVRPVNGNLGIGTIRLYFSTN